MSETNLTLRQVGRRLFLLRREAGMSLRDVVATGIIGSTNTLDRLESGTRVNCTHPVIKALCELYGAEIGRTTAMVEWYRNANRSWGEEFRGAVIPDFHRLIDMEEYVSAMDIYEPSLITGLAQTEAYARAAHAKDPTLPAEVVERSLEVRLRRQQVYWGRDPLPTTRLLMSEAALTGASDAEQVERLKALPADVRVLPLAAGPYPSLRGPFSIFRFDDELDPDCLYTEGMEGSRYDSKPTHIAAYDRVFRSSFEQATPIGDF